MSEPREQQETRPPIDLEAERLVVAACLRDGHPVAGLDARMFAGDFYRRIYTAISRLAAAEGEATLPKVAMAMRDEIDASRLSDLTWAAPPSATVPGFVASIRDRARVREVGSAAQAAHLAAIEGDWTRAREHAEALTSAVAAESAPGISVVDVSDVELDPPAWRVDGLIESGGMTLWWAAPGTGKSYLLLALAGALMTAEPMRKLWGHDRLIVRKGYGRVLWIAGEESPGRFAWRWSRIRKGLDQEPKDCEMLHVWGPAGCTLADLPRLIDEHKPDAIVVDPLRAILPSTWGGESINWDADTEATTKVCGMIRNASKGSGADLHLVHHPRKAGDSYGGNVAWLASVDCMVRLDPKGKPCASRWRSNARGRRWRRSMS